jgi:hypothetical protein
MSERLIVCCLKRLTVEGTLWADEDIAVRPVSEWRVCMKYLSPANHEFGAYMPIGYLIPLEADDE